jgi:hypothetical protein
MHRLNHMETRHDVFNLMANGHNVNVDVPNHIHNMVPDAIDSVVPTVALMSICCKLVVLFIRVITMVSRLLFDELSPDGFTKEQLFAQVVANYVMVMDLCVVMMIDRCRDSVLSAIQYLPNHVVLHRVHIITTISILLVSFL